MLVSANAADNASCFYISASVSSANMSSASSSTSGSTSVHGVCMLWRSISSDVSPVLTPAWLEPPTATDCGAWESLARSATSELPNGCSRM
ncbi:hypothetical protein PF008_g28329 [Phytophthora fragariae]|uniref:Uncharacterized protein n=1 Tax=Phytophthora fragariae TaxID=53985 RepID=A0A6G0QC61_9STRA|nr:hypothetical protein PF008_g28329 [Phytophthora fragariae]